MVLAKHALNKKLVADGLLISNEAKLAKTKDAQVIDATIGCLYNEEGNLYLFESVKEAYRNLSLVNTFSYSSTDGGDDFRNHVLKWVFREHQDAIEHLATTRVVATPGGTGALALSLHNTLNQQETLLIPDLYWGPYMNMAVLGNVDTVTFPLLKNDEFNLTGFITCAEKLIARQQKLVFILNDPCNNPTGYSLTLEELKAVVGYCSKQTVGINIIYDIAYFDFDNENNVQEKLLLLAQAASNVLVNICFSASKSFSIYGLRCGAQILLGQNKDTVNTAYDSSCYFARSRWSNSSKMGISLLNDLIKNQVLYEKMLEEIKQAKALLNKRASIFLKEAKECGLDVFKYCGGFFVAVKSKDAKKIFERLKAQKIYVLLFIDCMRISISALKTTEVMGLAQKIKNCEKLG